jgi:hypothetical protein
MVGPAQGRVTLTDRPGKHDLECAIMRGRNYSPEVSNSLTDTW